MGAIWWVITATRVCLYDVIILQRYLGSDFNIFDTFISLSFFFFWRMFTCLSWYDFWLLFLIEFQVTFLKFFFSQESKSFISKMNCVEKTMKLSKWWINCGISIMECGISIMEYGIETCLSVQQWIVAR